VDYYPTGFTTNVIPEEAIHSYCIFNYATALIQRPQHEGINRVQNPEFQGCIYEGILSHRRRSPNLPLPQPTFFTTNLVNNIKAKTKKKKKETITTDNG
jgi:hypothetical protein